MLKIKDISMKLGAFEYLMNDGIKNMEIIYDLVYERLTWDINVLKTNVICLSYEALMLEKWK